MMRLSLHIMLSFSRLHPASAGPEQSANVGQSTDCKGEPIPITAATAEAFHVCLWPER